MKYEEEVVARGKEEKTERSDKLMSTFYGMAGEDRFTFASGNPSTDLALTCIYPTFKS